MAFLCLSVCDSILSAGFPIALISGIRGTDACNPLGWATCVRAALLSAINMSIQVWATVWKQIATRTENHTSCRIFGTRCGSMMDSAPLFRVLESAIPIPAAVDALKTGNCDLGGTTVWETTQISVLYWLLDSGQKSFVKSRFQIYRFFGSGHKCRGHFGSGMLSFHSKNNCHELYDLCTKLQPELWIRLCSLRWIELEQLNHKHSLT